MDAEGRLIINERLSIPLEAVQIEYMQASGPGGQNVNKVATKARLRFDTRSARLPEEMRQRLLRIAKNRITADGFLLIEAQRYRSQERNRQDALDRLAGLLRQAAVLPKARRKTTPSAAARQARLRAKRRRAEVKRLRARVSADE